MNLLQQIENGVSAIIDDIVKGIGYVIAGVVAAGVMVVMASPLLLCIYIVVHFIIKYW
jgi:hypothetical protein